MLVWRMIRFEENNDTGRSDGIKMKTDAIWETLRVIVLMVVCL